MFSVNLWNKEAGGNVAIAAAGLKACRADSAAAGRKTMLIFNIIWMLFLAAEATYRGPTHAAGIHLCDTRKSAGRKMVAHSDGAW
jgi:hypothetical protein